MTYAMQTTFPASLAPSPMMAASPMNEGIPVMAHLLKSSRAGLITKMPSHQPNRKARRAYAREYGQEFPTITPPTPRKRLTRFTAAELMAMDFPELVFLVEGILPTGLIMTAGAPKIGKSLFYQLLSTCIAAGRPFLGRKTSQGSVLYLALEDTGRRLVDRLETIVPPGTDFDRLPLEFWLECPRADEGGFEAIEEWLKAAVNPKLVVIDVWGRFAPSASGASKNEYDQTTRAMQPLQALANRYGVAICLVHHTKKTSSDGSTSADMFDQVLGSRALTSNMDATLMLTRTRMANDATLSITGRDIEEQQLNLNFDPATLNWNEVGRELAPSLSPELQATLDAIAAGRTKTGELLAHFGINHTALQNRLASLLDKGIIKRVSRGVYCLAGQPAADLETDYPGDMDDLGDVAETNLADLI